MLSNWGCTGLSEGEISSPSGIVFDSADDLYVVDSLNDRICKFTKEGIFLLAWGKSGEKDGQFLMSMPRFGESGSDLDHPAGVVGG